MNSFLSMHRAGISKLNFKKIPKQLRPQNRAEVKKKIEQYSTPPPPLPFPLSSAPTPPPYEVRPSYCAVTSEKSLGPPEPSNKTSG